MKFNLNNYRKIIHFKMKINNLILNQKDYNLKIKE